MCVIDVDAKYNTRPVRWHGSRISAAVLAMADARSGTPKTDWIVEVWYVRMDALPERRRLVDDADHGASSGDEHPLSTGGIGRWE